MGEAIRLLIVGTGQMGSRIARLALAKQGLELVGAYGRRAARAGTDLGQAIGLERTLGLAIENDLDSAVKRTKPHIAIQATCSRLHDARDEISMLLRHGVHVISIAEEMTYPAHCSPETATELNELARSHGVSVLGTGINPGFVLDLLIVTLTGVCSEVEAISATRVNDLSAYGPAVLKAQGVGLTPAAFQRGVADGTVTGHLGFPQSFHMIASALGWDIAKIEEKRQPIVSEVQREAAFATVQPGQVAGCLHTAVAYRRGKPAITLYHPQQIRPELAGVETGDSIEISGRPNVRLAGAPEIPGAEGTAAIAINMIPRVMNAAPGLHTMTDLPAPAAMLGDVRVFLREI